MDNDHKLTFDLKVTPSFNAEDQVLQFETSSHAQVISREVIRFKEETTREALIALGWTPPAAFAVDEQRNALAEARLRIIARIDGTDKDAGLQEARRIIGAMWDELPVSKPQAVVDHEKRIRQAIQKPQPEDFGYEAMDGFGEHGAGGWQYEGGEEAYDAAVSAWETANTP